METKKYSQLNATLALAKSSLKATFRNPSVVVFSIIFPLIFIVVFGFIGSGGSSLSLAVKNGTDTESPIYKAIEGIETIKIEKYDSEQTLNDDLQKGHLDGLLYITKSGDQPAPKYDVKLTTSEASPQNGALLQSIISGIVDKTNLAAFQKQGLPVSFSNDKVSGRKFKTIDFILPGQLGFSLLNIGVIGTAFLFLSLRETLVLKRFFATPIKKSGIILGQTISRLIFSLIQVAVIVGVGTIFMGYTLVHGFSTLLSMLVLSIIGLLVFMGFGFIISGIAKNNDAVAPLSNIVTLPQFLLGGTFFPIEAFPSWLQPISKGVPIYYLNDALRKVAFEGANLWQVHYQIGILLLWGIVVYLAAVKFFKWE